MKRKFKRHKKHHAVNKKPHRQKKKFKPIKIPKDYWDRILGSNAK